MKTSRLLIMACSKRKRPSIDLLPAVERYNGPTYQVLRRYTRQSSEPPLTLALSAEFGLVHANHPLPDYNRRMTSDRATMLRSNIGECLRSIVADSGGFSEALICAGQQYLGALQGIEGILHCPVTYANGSLGRQVTILHQWLYGPSLKATPAPISAEPVRFRGQLINYTTEQILNLAQIKAQEDPAGAGRFEGWYVPAGRFRIAPKWLLSLLTGIPVAQFRTADALKVIAKLGITSLHI